MGQLTERHVEVEVDWYVRLATYLKPEERWSAEDNPATLILYSVDFSSGDTTRLYFFPKEKSDE